MPSWQSYVLDPVLRIAVKRHLGKVGSPQEARKAFEHSAPPSPVGAKHRPGSVGGVKGDWVSSGGVPAGTLLYLHGGGYFACSPTTHRAITGALANRGFRVFAADYRLAPEHPFPAAVDDALSVYKALLAEGVSPMTLVIAGDSAGGGLVLATLLAAKAAGLPMPSSALLFSPWTDLAATGESLKSNLRRDPMLRGERVFEATGFYVNGADPKNPLISPLYGDLSGLPPLCIQVGDGEVLRDDSVRLADRAKAAGVKVYFKIWKNVPHVWQLFQFFLPEARAAVAEASAFAKANFRA
jgi:monoterpene epsilon-lactone hydrolase